MSMLTLRTHKAYDYRIEFFDENGSRYVYCAESTVEFLLLNYWLSYYFYDGQVGDEVLYSAIEMVDWSPHYASLSETIECLGRDRHRADIMDVDQYYQGQYMHFAPSNADMVLVEKLYRVMPNLTEWERILKGFHFQCDWEHLCEVLERPNAATLLSFGTLMSLLEEPLIIQETELNL